MKVGLELAFDEAALLRLANWLANENRLIFEGNPELPGLYESGIIYESEKDELWADYINTLLKGKEDCDALAAIRAGELQARGWRALSPTRGDYGARLARDLRLHHIPGRVVFRTKVDKGESGLYHCIVKYHVGPYTFYDDPSARLGMYGGKVDKRQPIIRNPDVREFVH